MEIVEDGITAGHKILLFSTYTSMFEILEKELQNMKVLVEKTFAYSEAGRIQSIRKYGQMLVEEYRQDGIYVKAYVPKSLNI